MARVGAFYALGYEGVMRLPMRAFWLFSNSIDRIQAAQDQRTLRVLVCAQSNGEAVSGLIQELSDRMGEVTRFKKSISSGVSNRKGIAALRALQATLGG